MKTLTAKKAREQITCTGQDSGEIHFNGKLIGTLSSAADEKGKVAYTTTVTTNGEFEDETIPHHLKASKRNALLDKVAKLVSSATQAGTWHY